MSNAVLLWSMLIFPWLTLFFMPKASMKRWMPVALFSAISSVVAVELGENLGWFIYGQAAYPLRTSSYIIFGLNIVTTLWIFHFLYGHFWRYIAIDTLLNFGFIYVGHVYILGSRELFREVGLTPFQNTLIVILVGGLAYGYQMWQEGIFAQAERHQAIYRTPLQPAAGKPLAEDPDKKNSE